jgi:Holliday junction resolvase RusA-like endonuclease
MIRKTGHTYNPNTAKEWKETIQTYFMLHRQPQIEGPVNLSVSFFLPKPKRLVGVDRSIPHVSKPDADNLLKAVMDAMTDAGIWRDDSLVFSISVDKWYARGEPGAQIIVKVGFEGP